MLMKSSRYRALSRAKVENRDPFEVLLEDHQKEASQLMKELLSWYWKYMEKL
jgi:hypothetical protein